MDTKSKNSRKFGILILILLLAASSAVMMLQYGTIRRQIESVQEEGSRSGETAADMANTLAEGNYLLYNRYVRDTDPAEVLSLYGQQRFDLAEKYLDYELIDSKDEVIASDLPEEEQEKLHEDGKGVCLPCEIYFFRKRRFGGYPDRRNGIRSRRGIQYGIDLY